MKERKQFELFREIIVDNFAGGGGASTGISIAIGRSVDIAINHDKDAIAMHQKNHPGTEHYCESVWDIDPVKVVAGRPVALCWFSPDCKHFSKAKGGKPVDKNIRGLAWVAIRWAATVKPRVIMLENVEEFKTWGPLLKNGMPDPDKKGRTFQAFINALKRQGYQVDYRELRACDYGAPTIRKRFFMVARRDGQPIVWPEPTHGDPKSAAVKSGKLLPWRTAAEIIDWSLPCPSIFERKRPLAENTMRRIARGIQKFVIDNPEPFIINYKFTNEPESIENPLSTVTSVNGHYVVEPFIARIGQTGFGGDRMQYSIDDPLTTIVSKAEHLLVTPTLMVNNTGHPGSKMDDPACTITTGNHQALIMPVISRQFGKSIGSDIKDPLGTVTAGGGGKTQLVSAVLVGAGGPTYSGKSVPVDEPMGSLVTENHKALVQAFITKFRTGATGSAIDEPLHTITSGAGSKRPAGAPHAMGLVAANLIKYHGLKSDTDTRGQLPDEAIKTVDTANRFSVVTSHLMKMRGTCQHGQPVTEPAPTITAGGLHIAEVRAFLIAYYGTSTGQKCGDPLQTVVSKDRFGLVTIHGEDYQIVDIGMRMLEPRELFNAQGFPANYVIDIDADGKKISKSGQVARCGNAVPPAFAEALVRANLPELCGAETRREAAK